MSLEFNDCWKECLISFYKLIGIDNESDKIDKPIVELEEVIIDKQYNNENIKIKSRTTNISNNIKAIDLVNDDLLWDILEVEE